MDGSEGNRSIPYISVGLFAQSVLKELDRVAAGEEISSRSGLIIRKAVDSLDGLGSTSASRETAGTSSFRSYQEIRTLLDAAAPTDDESERAISDLVDSLRALSSGDESPEKCGELAAKAREFFEKVVNIAVSSLRFPDDSMPEGVRKIAAP